MRLVGVELRGPGLRSARRTVPSGVPLVCQSSVPSLGVVAVKQTTLPSVVRESGEEEVEPREMSLSRVVPDGVPSLTQSSRPFWVVVAAKRRRPLLAVSSEGLEEAMPGARSMTCSAELERGSYFQSSVPKGLVAEK